MFIKAQTSASPGVRAYSVHPTLTDRLTIRGMADVYQVTTDIPTTLKLSGCDSREFCLCSDGRKFMVKFRKVENGDSVNLVALFIPFDDVADYGNVWEAELGEWFRINPAFLCIRAAIRQFPS